MSVKDTIIEERENLIHGEYNDKCINEQVAPYQFTQETKENEEIQETKDEEKIQLKSTERRQQVNRDIYTMKMARQKTIGFKKNIGNRIFAAMKFDAANDNAHASNKTKEDLTNERHTSQPKSTDKVKVTGKLKAEVEMMGVNNINDDKKEESKDDKKDDDESSPFIESIKDIKINKSWFFKKALIIVVLLSSLIYITFSKFFFFKNFIYQINSISSYYEELNNMQKSNYLVSIKFKEGIYKSFDSTTSLNTFIFQDIFINFFISDHYAKNNLLTFDDFIVKKYRDTIKDLNSVKFCEFMYSTNSKIVSENISFLTYENCKSLTLLSKGVSLFNFEVMHGLFESFNIYHDMINDATQSEADKLTWRLSFLNSVQINTYYLGLTGFVRFNDEYWKTGATENFTSYISFGISVFCGIFVLFIFHSLLLLLYITKILLQKLNMYLEKQRVLISVIPQMDIFDNKEIIENLNYYL